MIWEGAPTSARIRRDIGVWHVTVFVKLRSKLTQSIEEFEMKNENGTVPTDTKEVLGDVLGSVGTSRGMTVNLGNYESARLDIWITLPTTQEDVDKNYEFCEHFAETKLKEEVAGLREYIKERS